MYKCGYLTLKNKKIKISECLLPFGVLRVVVLFYVLVLNGLFCYGALKLDISTLFTTFFL